MAEPKEKEKKQILDKPENWEEMVKKYQEREEEQIKRMLESKKVSTIEELQSLAKKSITSRSHRTSRDHEPLKSHTILVEPKSQEIKTLRQQLNEEISSLFSETIKQLPKLKISPSGLKGRVTISNVPIEEQEQLVTAQADSSSPF